MTCNDLPAQRSPLLAAVLPLTYECGGCSTTLRRGKAGPAPELCAECRQAANRARAASRRRSGLMAPRPRKIKPHPAQQPTEADRHLGRRVALLRLANLNAAGEIRRALDDYLTTGAAPELAHLVAASISALDYLDSVPTGRGGI